VASASVASALIFNSSLFLEGVFVLLAAYFLYLAYHKPSVTIPFYLGGIGAIGGAFFPEDVGSAHSAISILSFFAAGITPFITLRLQKLPLLTFPFHWEHSLSEPLPFSQFPKEPIHWDWRLVWWKG
jgi:hypothetical protein